MTFYALHDIKSHSSGKIYARMSDEVEIYNVDHAPVMCCRVRGEIFPCRVDRLSESPVVVPEVEVEKPVDLFNQIF